jgi:hypothetical protein
MADKSAPTGMRMNVLKGMIGLHGKGRAYVGMPEGWFHSSPPVGRDKSGPYAIGFARLIKCRAVLFASHVKTGL